MFAKSLSASLLGVEAFLVRVEAHATGGTYAFRMVGLPAKTVREAERRVRAALQASNYEFPDGKVTVSLAPAELPKSGAALDLAIAVALARVSAPSPLPAADGRMFLGELALDGRLRPVRGALAAADRARRAGLAGVVVPWDNAPEARAVEGIEVWGARSLSEVLTILAGASPAEPGRAATPPPPDDGPDLSEIRGQDQARRALEIAAAGGHNLLLTGPPGTGKSMLAARLPSILPPLEGEEAIEATCVHSAAGTLPEGTGLLRRPPFRAPHHTISYAGLLGGGSVPQPGEASLAHHGVLFLDEMPEYSRPCLEGLRQPMETGSITIVRRAARAVFPACFLLVGARNPCLCGHRGHPEKRCTCGDGQVARYQARISGPLLDRIDLHAEVPAVPLDTLLSRSRGEPSRTVRPRVIEARARAAARGGPERNALMGVEELERWCSPGEAGRDHLADAQKRQGLSARGVHRVLRVARTIADLDGSDRLRASHVLEALQYREA